MVKRLLGDLLAGKIAGPRPATVVSQLSPSFVWASMTTEAQHADHYANVASVYETTWCYQEEGDCQKMLCDKVVEHLPPKVNCRSVVDVGSGTGSFSIMVQRASGVEVKCVEPSAAMAAKAEERGLSVVVDGAYEWACTGDGTNSDDTASALLLKEVRHHFEEPEKVYKELVSRRLEPGGRLINITRPDTSQGYPFPKAAHQSWEVGNHVKLDRHLQALRDAGLQDVEMIETPFRVSMSKTEWERLLRMRFWSNLSVLSDDEMEQGIKDLDLPLVVEFDDRFIFIVGTKPS